MTKTVYAVVVVVVAVVVVVVVAVVAVVAVVVVAKAPFSVIAMLGLSLVPSVLSSSTESTQETSLLEAVFSHQQRIKRNERNGQLKNQLLRFVSIFLNLKLPSYVFTDSKFITWRITWYSSEMPFPVGAVKIERDLQLSNHKQSFPSKVTKRW